MANPVAIRELLVEKYRPTTLDDYVFQNEDTKKLITKWVEEGEYPNVLLSGGAGCGKSTLARILSSLEGIESADVKRVNGSSTNGVGFIRDELEPWLRRSSYGNFKVVVIEECLHEDELVRIGTPSKWENVRIGDLPNNEKFPVVSINMDTGKLENDIGEIISDKVDEVYEIELMDGRTIRVTEDHPMLVMSDGKIVEKSIGEGLSTDNGLVIAQSKLDDYGNLTVRIKSITPIGNHRVVNLTVEKNHTFVTANGICVHNCDRLSANAQDALRVITEEFSDDVRFIMTANHPRRISEALQSRFEAGRIHFEDINQDGIIDLCLDIIEAEGIHVEEPEDFRSHIEAYAPDIRKVINSIDRHTIDKVLTPLVEKVSSGDIGQWITTWEGEEFDWIILLSMTEGIDASNFDDYFQVMYENSHHFPNLSTGLIHLAEYLYRCSFVANHRLLLDACLYHIFEVEE